MMTFQTYRSERNNPQGRIAITKAIAIFSALICAIGVNAQTITKNVKVRWDANPDPNVAGYCLYYGGSSSNYTTRIDAGTNTSAVVPGLPGGQTYYFAATAYNLAKVESNPSAEASFFVNTNPPPVLTLLSNRVVNVQEPLRVTNSATLGSLLATKLTYSLDPGAPLGMRINPKTGLLTWIPTMADAGQTYEVTVRVTDDAVPPASAVQSFNAVVNHAAQLTLGQAVVSVGQTSSVPVTFYSSIGVTNFSFTLDTLTNRLSAVSAQSLDPQNVAVSLQSAGANRARITVQSLNGQVLQAQKDVVQLNLTTRPNRPSAFGPLTVTTSSAVQTNNQAVPKTISLNGRVVFVGSQPLLEALATTNGQKTLMLYAQVGSNFQVQSQTAFNPSGSWKPAYSGAMSNLSLALPNVPTAPAIFYRAYTY